MAGSSLNPGKRNQLKLAITAKIHAVWLGVSIALLVSLTACAIAPQQPVTPQPEPTFPSVHVTADQATQALQSDSFFSTYGQTTLLIQGTVMSIGQQSGDYVVALATTGPAKVFCDIGAKAPAVNVGAAITIQSANPQRDASREASGLLIKNCTIVPAQP
jgi:hypothetical protein